MERMAAALGSFLARQLELDEERQEVLTYGALVLIQNGVTAVLILLGAALLGLVPQALAVMVAAAVMRHASGGAHVEAAERCTVASTVALLLYAYLGWLATPILESWPLGFRIGLTGSMALAAYVAILQYAPVEAENRPLSPVHRRRLRRLSVQVGFLLFGLALVGGAKATWWVAPGLLGYFMQSFSLTPAGHRVARAVDVVFIRLQKGVSG